MAVSYTHLGLQHNPLKCEYYLPSVVSRLLDSNKDVYKRQVINSMTNNKFVIIIDEWDVLIRDEAANSSVQELSLIHI